MNWVAHLPSAFLGLAIGLGLAYATRPDGQASAQDASASPDKGSSTSASRANPATLERQLDQIDRSGIWINVPEDLYQSQLEEGRWANMVSAQSQFSPLLARALDIPEADIPKIQSVLQKMRTSFHEIDRELHQLRREDKALILTVPAYPKRGQEVLDNLQAALAELTSERAADVIVAITRGSYAEATVFFGSMEKEIRVTTQADGKRRFAWGYGGKPRASSTGLDYWLQHLAPLLDEE